MTILSVQNIHKSYGETRALRGVSFDVSHGEIIGLLGPSGCGKSTLLQIIAGLEEPDRGQVTWQGADLRATSTHQRGFGLMFQDYALFPHLKVAQNISFGLRTMNWPQSKIQSRVQDLVHLVNLSGFEGRAVDSLSGGEQQQVALARSLAPNPQLLMLDEPLGSLDRALRENLLDELVGILQEIQQTVLYVTHDQEEAFGAAKRVVVMNAGQVEQVGTPFEIYQHPHSPFVARFLGFENLIPGNLELSSAGLSAVIPFGVIDLSTISPPWSDSSKVPHGHKSVEVLLRPDSARLLRSGLQSGGGEWSLVLEGRITERTFRGNNTRLHINTQGHILIFDFPSNDNLPAVGDTVQLGIIPETVQLFLDGERAFSGFR